MPSIISLHESINQPEEPRIDYCRFCNSSLLERFITVSKRVNKIEQARQTLIPTFVCSECFLVQAPQQPFLRPDEPFYESSFSSSWLSSLKKFSDRAFSKLEFTNQGLAVELACLKDEFSERLAFQKGLSAFIDTYGKADLLLAHDALTHIPDINDFLSAVKLFLSPKGIVTFEFLHIVQLLADANREAHVSTPFPYFAIATWDKMLSKYGMVIFEVEPYQPKGSLRIYAKHVGNPANKISDRVGLLRRSEQDNGIYSLSTYIEYKTQSNIQPIVYA